MSELRRYPDYKDSGVPWLGDIPSHWEVKKLKHSVTYNDEALSDKTDPQYEIEYIDISSVSLIEGITKKEKMTFDNSPSRARRIVKKGDVIVSTVRTYLKAIAQVEDDIEGLIVSTGFAVLRSKDELLPDYLGYWVQSDYIVSNIMSRSVGVSYPAINATDLVRLPIIKIPKLEQQAIVNFLDNELDHIDTLISKQKQLLDRLAEQRSAVITHAVTKGLDPDVPLKDSGVEWLGEIPKHWNLTYNKYLFNFSRGLTITKADLLDEGIPCVSYGEVHSKYGFEVDPNIHPLKYVPEDYAEKFKYAVLKEGDFIFADTSEDHKGSGNFTHLSGQTLTMAGYHTVVMKQKYDYNHRYLAYMFDSEVFRTQVRKQVSGVKVFSITQGMLKRMIVWLPPKAEQDDLANYLDKQVNKIDYTSKATTDIITKLQEYRAALITQAVTGKIDVRHLNKKAS